MFRGDGNVDKIAKLYKAFFDKRSMTVERNLVQLTEEARDLKSPKAVKAMDELKKNLKELNKDIASLDKEITQLRKILRTNYKKPY